MPKFVSIERIDTKAKPSTTKKKSVDLHVHEKCTGKCNAVPKKWIHRSTFSFLFFGLCTVAVAWFDGQMPLLQYLLLSTQQNSLTATKWTTNYQKKTTHTHSNESTIFNAHQKPRILSLKSIFIGLFMHISLNTTFLWAINFRVSSQMQHFFRGL